MSDDLIERLRSRAGEDHLRGCAGRNYTCTCGFDTTTEDLLTEAASRLEALSVGGGRTYSQTEVDAILKAAFPRVSALSPAVVSDQESARSLPVTDHASDEAATPTPCDLEWRPMSQKPPEVGGAYINVRSSTTYRWLPYKPDGARQMKKAGRWQAHDGYGFTNAELPENGEWQPLPSPEPTSNREEG